MCVCVYACVCACVYICVHTRLVSISYTIAIDHGEAAASGFTVLTSLAVGASSCCCRPT